MEKDLKDKIDAIMADARAVSPGMAVDLASALTIATMETAVRDTVDNAKAMAILKDNPAECILATVVTALQMMREILAPGDHRPDLKAVAQILDRHGVLPELGVVVNEREEEKRVIRNVATGTARKPGEYLH